MSSFPELDEGNSLFVNEDYQGARDAFTRGLARDPSQPDLLARRSAALLKLKDFGGALADATLALQTDPSHIQALLRQGIAAFSLENFVLAKISLNRGLSLLPADSSLRATFQEWLNKTLEEIARHAPPSTDSPSSSSSSAPPSSSPTPTPTPSSTAAVPSTSPASQGHGPIEILPASTYRQDWYQNPTHVTIEVFVRETKAEQTTLQIRPKHFSLVVRLDNNQQYHLSFDLADEVKPETVRVAHLKSKIEIRLEKSKPAHWKTLEPTSAGIAVTDWFAGDPEAPPQTYYPTSAKVKKDWTKIASEIEEEKPSGDAALNKVFQDIYANGSEEQRRAMIKSFTESGGTVLSTNWGDVGARKVECTPPKGLEAKTWSE